MSEVAVELAELIKWDTRNPGGNERALALDLEKRLARARPDKLDILESQEGRASVLAQFGARPELLVNAHLDTVPAASGWSAPPLEARLAEDRVYGLGAADTKGAIAAILCAAAVARPRNLAILFSGDEERSGSEVRAFLERKICPTLERAIVCEPTSLRMGVRHRGLLAFAAKTRGTGGHSSRADLEPKPTVALARFAVALDDWAQQQLEVGTEGFRGMCVNVGVLRGGVAFNVIPEQAEMAVSLRPPPGTDLAAVQKKLAEMVPGKVEWARTAENPPFATREVDAFKALLGPPEVDAIAVDFWTEAALYAAAGIDAVVFGPGDIAQAHAPDEHVAIAQLEQAKTRFAALFARL